MTASSVIYRYSLDITNRQALTLPAGARILSVQHRQGTVDHIDMWALVDTAQPVEPRVFRVFGTGHPVTDVHQLTYLGSVQVMAGELVFHVFEQQPAGAS